MIAIVCMWAGKEIGLHIRTFIQYVHGSTELTFIYSMHFIHLRTYILHVQLIQLHNDTFRMYMCLVHILNTDTYVRICEYNIMII